MSPKRMGCFISPICKANAFESFARAKGKSSSKLEAVARNGFLEPNPKAEILTWRSQNQEERKKNREIREIREKKSPDEELAGRIVRMLWQAGFFSFAYFAYFAVPQIEAILDAISEGRSERRPRSEI